jgi:hypothetical protein
MEKIAQEKSVNAGVCGGGEILSAFLIVFLSYQLPSGENFFLVSLAMKTC